MAAAPTKKPKSTWLNLAIDFGPLLVFFLAYRHYSPAGDTHGAGFGSAIAVTKSTAAFMVATVIALVVSKWKLGKIAPTLWLSSVLIVAFGGLTIYFNDPKIIQIKPTALYLLFAIVLIGGLWQKKAMLKYLLQDAFEGLDEEGWLILSKNWGYFFIFLAVLNEVLRHFYNNDNGGFPTWIWFKATIFPGVSFLFTFTQVPMLLRHGLTQEAKPEAEANPPHD